MKTRTNLPIHYPEAVDQLQGNMRHQLVPSLVGAVPVRPSAVELSEGSSSSGPIQSSIILPAYNEALALPVVLRGLFSVIDDTCEVIVVDDGSSDATVAIARTYPCRVICHLYNQGKGAAVQTGLAAARGSLIIIMDADDTYPASAIPEVLSLLNENDFVRAIRRADKESMPTINRLGNVIFDLVLKVAHGLEGSDHLSGLYGLRREALQLIRIDSDGFDLEVEIGIKVRAMKMRAASFPITYQPRLGEKKLNAYKDGWRILSRIFSLTLLYNPRLVFIIPGIMIWLMAMGLTLLLSRGPVLTPFFGLDIHTLIVATLGIATGFQLIVFGIAASLYAVELGAAPSPWLTKLSSQRTRFGMALFGFSLAAIGGLLLATNIIHWLASNMGAFYGTRSTVLAAVLTSSGLQVILASLFISIFTGRIEKRTRMARKRQAPAAPSPHAEPPNSAEALNLPGSSQAVPTSMLLDQAVGEAS